MLDAGSPENYTMWKAALEYRGCSDDLIERAYRLEACPYNNRDAYNLLRRAETDHTWRFWWDALSPKVTKEHIKYMAIGFGISFVGHGILAYGLSRVLAKSHYAIALAIIGSAEMGYGLRQMRIL